MYPADQFDAGKDSDVLKKAVGKTLGVDDKAIVSVMCSRSSTQRQQIKAAYAKMFGKVPSILLYVELRTLS